MNRTIYFSAFVFLLLLALLFLLSHQLSRFSAPRSMLQSGKAIDRTAVEKATLISPHAVGLFPIRLKSGYRQNDQPVDSSVDAAINKITRRLRRVQRHLKDRAHPSRHRPIMANLVIRIHSWLVGEFGLAYTTNGRAMKRRSDKWTKAQKAAHGCTSSGSRIQGSRAELN